MKITKSLLKQMIAEEMSEVFQSGLHTMEPSEAHKHYQEAVKDHRAVAGKIYDMLPEEQKEQGERAIFDTEHEIKELMKRVNFVLENEGMSRQQKEELLEDLEDLDYRGNGVLEVLRIVNPPEGTPEELEELVYELHKKYEVAEKYLRGILEPEYTGTDPSGADLADSGKQMGLGLQEKDEEEDKVNPDFDRDYDEYGRVYQESKLQQENLDPDKHYLMDGGRVYKGPFDSYEEAEAASDVGGLQIKSPKPKFSKAQMDAADAAKKRFGLEEAGETIEDPHDKEKVKEAMGYAMSILKHLDFSAQPSIDYDKIRWDLLEGPPTKDALQYAVSTLKDVDFSAVPTVNYDDIRWDLLDGALKESKKDMLKRIVTEEVVKLELEAMKESGQLDEITVGPSGIKFGGEGGRQDDPADANLDDMSARGVLGRMGSDSEEGRQAKAAMDKFLLRHQNRAEVRAKNKRDQFSAVKDTGERAIIDAARKRSEKLAVNIERIRNSLKDGDLTKEESVYIMSIDGSDDLKDYNDDAVQPRDKIGS